MKHTCSNPSQKPNISLHTHLKTETKDHTLSRSQCILRDSQSVQSSLLTRLSHSEAYLKARDCPVK